jgi:hypothetical protein
VVEQHSDLRFAWLRKRESEGKPEKRGALSRLLTFAYNLVWWVPLALPFLTDTVGYREGMIGFGLITLTRAIINSYRVNLMNPRDAQRFPLRLPG